MKTMFSAVVMYNLLFALFTFSSWHNGYVESDLMRNLKLISKLMTSQAGQQMSCFKSLLNWAIAISKLSMEHIYGIQLSQIFQIPSISNENLVFRLKNSVFQIRNYEMLGFSHTEFEVLGILTEISSISKKVSYSGFWMAPVYIFLHWPL